MWWVCPPQFGFLGGGVGCVGWYVLVVDPKRVFSALERKSNRRKLFNWSDRITASSSFLEVDAVSATETLGVNTSDEEGFLLERMKLLLAANERGTVF